MKTRFKNVTVDPDRHGKLRARFRKAGRKPVYMQTLPDQPGFAAEYKALCEDRPDISIKVIPGSVHDLCARYLRSADYMARGGTENKRNRIGLIESFREEFGSDLVANFGFEHIEAILLARVPKRKNDKGRTVGGQVAATNLRKQLMRLFAYAKKLKWIASNPVEEAAKVGVERIAGYYTWTEADIARYQEQHPLGTKARLALEIVLWTGQRRSDARLFGPRHIARGKVNYQAHKTGADLWLPVARDLRRAIDAMPSVGLTTYLVTSHGKPFGNVGFGNKFREWCDEAGLPQCTAHGLRKAIARRMAQIRLTDEEMKSVGGWRNTTQLRVYTEAVEQEALADGAMEQIDQRYSTDGDG